MRRFAASLHNELAKLAAQPRTRGFLLAALLLPLGFMLLSARLSSGTGLASLLGGDPYLTLLGGYTAVVLPLFLCLTAAEQFAGEGEAGTIRLSLVRPVSRGKIYGAKVLAAALYTGLQLLLVAAVCLLCGWLLPGSSPAGALGAAPAAKAALAAWAAMLTVGVVYAALAQLAGRTATAIALCLLVYGGAKLLPLLLPELSVWSLFSYTGWHTLWLGDGLPGARLWNLSALLLSYCIIAYTSGLVVFSKKSF
ncbi:MULTISPECIES: ABC transporter permease subunit [Paenibacillus]|uniref:ABC transporter permease subunit n=1 Tax=Paenibacillus TaxID=44249 RepID=UPI0022B8EECD|nr:ABC transporter permease subunit [Paenibacillus caseinilyticus]MCZ8523257.1 ABC transporter permease subunit [Paenibacillus caseinilyticus]